MKLDTDYTHRPTTFLPNKIPLFRDNTGGFPILNPHYKDINVLNQEQYSNSPLNFYRKLLHLRKNNSVFNNGQFQQYKSFQVLSSNPMSSAYTRSNFWGRKYLVIVNMDYTSQLVKINLGNSLTPNRLLLNTHNSVTYQNNLLELKPYQGMVVRV